MKIPNSLLIASVLALAFAGSAHATVLLTDDFSDSPNEDASTYNNNLASAQGGTLATTPYAVVGTGYVAQHSNSGNMIVATQAGVQHGSVSLNNNFATQANSFNQPLQISFNLVSVFNYADPARWIQFNVGASQNLSLLNPAVGIGVFFRVDGGTQAFDGVNTLGSASTWTANDLVTVTLSDTAGTGSAFNGNGTKATVVVGANNLGTFALDQQTNAYITFSAYSDDNIFEGGGAIDNLSVSVIPEPSSVALLLGGLGRMIAFLRRRR